MNLILIRPRNILQIPINEGNQTLNYMMIGIVKGVYEIFEYIVNKIYGSQVKKFPYYSRRAK